MTKVIAHITHKDNRKTPTGKEHLYSLTIKQWLYIISFHHPNCILYVNPIDLLKYYILIWNVGYIIHDFEVVWAFVFCYGCVNKTWMLLWNVKRAFCGSRIRTYVCWIMMKSVVANYIALFRYIFTYLQESLWYWPYINYIHTK